MINVTEAALLINKLENIKVNVCSRNLIDITPVEIGINQVYQIFKDISENLAYLYTSNKIYPIAQTHSGFGIINVVDIRKYDKNYLFYSVSYGNGVLGSKIVHFDLDLNKEAIIYTYNSFDFSALALMKCDNSIDIYKFEIRKMDWKLPFDNQIINKTMYAKLIVEQDMYVDVGEK
ncbi:hypothetical protein D3C76_327880 [compost metagenome]